MATSAFIVVPFVKRGTINFGTRSAGNLSGCIVITATRFDFDVAAMQPGRRNQSSLADHLPTDQIDKATFGQEDTTVTSRISTNDLLSGGE